MKKSRLACVLAACLVLTGCGESAATQEETVAFSDIAQQEIETTSASQGEITITTQHLTGEQEIEQTGLKYTYEYDVPTVSIPGNEAAQAAIQEDLQEYIDNSLADMTAEHETIDDADIEYYKRLDVKVLRADEQIISILITCEGYEGGAHGYVTQAYFNYYTASAERVTFDSLGSGFRQKAMELVRIKAERMQAKEDIFYEDYEHDISLAVLDGTELSTDIYNELYGAGDWGAPYLMTPTFYILDTGFGFTSGQYVLQPYAMGIVDFTFSAADFGDACEADIFADEAAMTPTMSIDYITEGEYNSFKAGDTPTEFGSFDAFEQTLAYDFTGTWYDAELGEAFRITEDGAYVYIPFLDMYGNELYEWELVDRSDKGLCPELDIYFGGRDVPPLAYYVGGARDTYFWCNLQEQIFYKQD